MFSPRLRTTLLLASLACLPAGLAWATPIAVINPSFEVPPPPYGNGCGQDCSYNGGPITGWTGGGSFQPGPPTGTTAYFNYVPDGVTVAYTNGGSITQTLGATVQNGVTYTFTVDIGTRKDTGAGGAAYLVIGGSDLILAAGTPATAGDWATYTATYTGTALTAGQSIGIELDRTGVQGDFDAVAVNATPEPSSIALLGTGLLGAAGIARRRLRNA